MKKIVYLFLTMFAIVVSSCNNDDDVLKKEVMFKVNPSTVVSEFNDIIGTLSVVLNNYELNVHLLIYNDAGKLVAEDVQGFSDYTHVMNSSLELDEGDYTAVALTYITRNDGFEYWSLSGRERLSTFKITDTGYIAEQNNILGLVSEEIRVTSSTTNIKMDVKPAGAIIYFLINNWDEYDDLVSYELMLNKSADSMGFDEFGESVYEVESASSYAWRCLTCDYNSEYSGYNGYVFMFPMSNVKFQWQGIDTNDEGYYFGNNKIMNIKAGYQYEFILDMSTLEATFEGYDVGARSGMPAKTPRQNNLMKTNAFDAESKTINVAEYIKGNLSK